MIGMLERCRHSQMQVSEAGLWKSTPSFRMDSPKTRIRLLLVSPHTESHRWGTQKRPGQDVEGVVHPNAGEHGEGGDGVDGRDQCPEEETLHQRKVGARDGRIRDQIERGGTHLKIHIFKGKRFLFQTKILKMLIYNPEGKKTGNPLF